jgi:hypothetical protein
MSKGLALIVICRKYKYVAVYLIVLAGGVCKPGEARLALQQTH